MFEKVVVRRATDASSTQAVDLGALAEAILFYEKTHLLIGRGSLCQLLRDCGVETTLRLVEGGYIQARYLHQNLGIHTVRLSDGRSHHAAAMFTVDGTIEEEVFGIWRAATGKSRMARRQVDRFLSLVPSIELPATLAEDTKTSILNGEFLEDAARAVLYELAPTYHLPSGFYFRPEEGVDGRFRVATNLDPVRASEAYRKLRGGEAGDLTIAHVLTEVFEMHAELYVGAEFGADSLASELSARLIELSGGDVLENCIGKNRIFEFSKMSMQGRSLREAINGGARSFDEVLPILDNSRKFREWVHGLPSDSDLLRAYFEECTKDSWVSRMPVRTFRWLLTTVATIPLNPIVGVVTSTLDTFLVDRLGSGWRPNQFINRRVVPFVSPDR